MNIDITDNLDKIKSIKVVITVDLDGELKEIESSFLEVDDNVESIKYEISPTLVPAEGSWEYRLQSEKIEITYKYREPIRL